MMKTKDIRRGISLIVIIITIIVVIILAAVVILTLSKNNPIESVICHNGLLILEFHY